MSRERITGRIAGSTKRASAYFFSSPLYYACLTKNYNKIAKLVGEGEDTSWINKLNSKGNSIFHRACKRGDLKFATSLLLAGADVAIVDKDGNTALHYACTAGNLDVVNLLLNRGADPFAVNNQELTPTKAIYDKFNKKGALVEQKVEIPQKHLDCSHAIYRYVEENYDITPEYQTLESALLSVVSTGSYQKDFRQEVPQRKRQFAEVAVEEQETPDETHVDREDQRRNNGATEISL